MTEDTTRTESLASLDELYEGAKEAPEATTVARIESTEANTADDAIEAESAEAEAKTSEATASEVKSTEDGASKEKKSSDVVPLAALVSERKKRHGLEEQNQELEEKLKAQEESQKERQEVPDPIDNPEGYTQHIAEKLHHTEVSVKVNTSRAFMLRNTKDYEEKEKVFLELAKTQPHLIQEMLQSDSPAAFTYNAAKEHLEIQKYRDPQYKEKLKEEVRSEVLKELQQNETNLGAIASALNVPDLTNAAAAGANRTEKITLDKLSDIMPE